MIIFTSNIQLLPFINDSIVYNLSSFYSGYESVSGLITNISVCNNTGMPNNIFIESPQFDAIYANIVLSTPDLFVQFMKIVLNSTLFNVVVLVSHDPYRDAITESIIKMIQIRYGYNCWSIEDIEDLESLRETDFSIQGMYTLDADKRILDQMNVRVNGILDVE